MKLMNSTIFYLIKINAAQLIIMILFNVKLIYAKTMYLSDYEMEQYIECYWCNSRDAYCGKRVTDTMVTTLKCPKTHRCTVYTNPYDNYYLHRGCTVGMDFGDLKIENGCFIEEDGSTYCFCDFNRCNAAGILELRNLSPSSLKSNEEQDFKVNYNTPTLRPQSTTRNIQEFPFKTSFNSNVNNLEDLLLDYLKFSKKHNNNNNSNNKFDKQSIIKLDNSNNFDIAKKIQQMSGGVPIGFTAIILNKTNPVTVTTKAYTKRTTIQNRIEKEKLDLLEILSKVLNKTKPSPSTPKSQISTLIPRKSLNLTLSPSSSSTPNSKSLENDYYKSSTNPLFDWISHYKEKYNSDNNLGFKCPADGLYKHPFNCGQFLQCAYVGTIYERYYTLTCPAGLYFNDRLKVCDYVQNVVC